MIDNFQHFRKLIKSIYIFFLNKIFSILFRLKKMYLQKKKTLKINMKVEIKIFMLENLANPYLVYGQMSIFFL